MYFWGSLAGISKLHSFSGYHLKVMGLPQPGKTRQQPPTDQWFGVLSIVAWWMTLQTIQMKQ